MKRSRLRTKYLKNNNEENRKLYTKHSRNHTRNHSAFLFRKTKKAYYENLGERKVSDSKLFWKTISLHYPKNSMPEKG